MEERRKFGRVQVAEGTKTPVLCGGIKQDVTVCDVSASGMRVKFSRSIDVGMDLFGKIQVLPESGPFFVKGKVVRVNEKDAEWETAVSFEKVSTDPFLLMYMYQMV